MIRVKATGLEEARERLAQVRDRAKNKTGASALLHDEILRQQRGRLAAHPVGSMNTLGPSLIQRSHPGHVYSFDGRRLVYGTDVFYASFYRRRTGHKITAIDVAKVGRVLAHWIATGEQ